MMHFTVRDDTVSVVRITGPSHNLLTLQLATVPADTQVEELDIPGPRCLAASDVAEAVRTGVDQANSVLGTQFSIRKIQFVPSDSGPASLYQDMAEAIVQHYAAALQPGDRPVVAGQAVA